MKRKVTYQIDERIVARVREAVDTGSADSISEFVQSALAERLDELRRREIRRSIQEATHDPLFVEDVRETFTAFDATSDDGLA